jgi:hypothetical protein
MNARGLASYAEQVVDGIFDNFGIYVRATRESLESSPLGLQVVTGDQSGITAKQHGTLALPRLRDQSAKTGGNFLAAGLFPLFSRKLLGSMLVLRVVGPERVANDTN